MTIIKPNSIAGVTSITAQGDVINLYKSDGTLAGLQLNGVNFNTTSGVSTFNNVTVGGTITYQDVAHVDSVGIITAQQGLQVLANGLNVTGVSTFNGNVGIGTDTPLTTIEAANFGSGESEVARFTRKNGSDNHGLRVKVDPDANTVTYTSSGSASGHHIFATTGSNEVVRITSSGNVGIGTDNPATTLHLRDTQAELRLVSDAGGYSQLQFGDTEDQIRGSIVYYATDDALLFYGYNNTEKLRITSTGDFVVAAGATFGASVGVVTYYGDGSQLSGISVGLTTESASPNNTITHLDLTNAQDHKLIVSGITTISVTGGTEADSHTIRIQNSGISTVGFSTYFLFPSGAAPTLPTADGAISLISFTVHRVGAAGTQLLAGASVNFS